MSISRSAVAKLETDKGMPDVNNLKIMAQLLNVSVDYLPDADAIYALISKKKMSKAEWIHFQAPEAKFIFPPPIKSVVSGFIGSYVVSLSSIRPFALLRIRDTLCPIMFLRS